MIGFGGNVLSPALGACQRCGRGRISSLCLGRITRDLDPFVGARTGRSRILSLPVGSSRSVGSTGIDFGCVWHTTSVDMRRYAIHLRLI